MASNGLPIEVVPGIEAGPDAVERSQQLCEGFADRRRHVTKLGEVEVQTTVECLDHRSELGLRSHQSAEEGPLTTVQEADVHLERLGRELVGEDFCQIGSGPFDLGARRRRLRNRDRHGAACRDGTGLDNPVLPAVVAELDVLWRAVVRFDRNKESGQL